MPNLIGCSVKGDKLYIFKIADIPTEKDWENSLSYYLPVEKGKLNQSSPKLSKLDKETIHASNKTCHHVAPSTPVDIKLSAFYNESNLFLRIQWPDKNKDDQPAVWDKDTKTFDKTKGSEDGLGIIWNKENIPSANCLSSCHLNEWQVQNSILTPTHQMKTKDNEIYDLWIWWAGRNTKDNSIWEINIDSSGIDENKYFLQNTGKTPNIYSQSFYKDGFWTLTITSPLNDNNKNFIAGNSYHFQIAVFDNTYSDHSITSEIQDMIFIKNEIKFKKDEIL
ncbi:MAG: ethylbenzene dehydrogenase-related protein [bacterium]|nr:ethylbenzene dehydrogenase-related protein [bacterium]